MRSILVIAIGCAFVLTSCGSQSQDAIPEQDQPSPRQEANTPPAANTIYGNAADIEAYLQAINPHIQEIGRIQLDVDKSVGSTGKATGENLAPAMEAHKPRLETVLESLGAIVPPPLLASFHTDVKKLVTLRISGYDDTVRGRAAEQSSGDIALYEKAEQTLREANTLIGHLNGEMQKINAALSSSTPTQTAAP